MSSETNPSPFAAMSYRDQQDRWLEWRSQQLEFQEAGMDEKDAKKPADAHVPPVSLPYLQQAAQPRHQNLDRVLTRHMQAKKQLSAFQPTETAP